MLKMRAMILAAGLGTRLRPITYQIPKPLVPIFQVPLIRYVLEVLKTAHIQDVMVNLHYLPKPLKQYLNTQKDFNISYSFEPEILGTGGGILKVKNFFKNEPFIVINSDIIMRLDLKKVLKFHVQHKSLATMVTRPLKPTETYESLGIHPKTGRIIQFKSKTIKPPLLKAMFTGIHIFEPEIFNYFPKNKKFFCINNDVYAHLIKKKMNVFGYIHQGPWYDIGSLDLYLKYNQDLKLKRSFLKLFPGIIFPKSTA